MTWENRLKNLFSISLHSSFWCILRHAALNFLGINKLFLRKFALPGRKFTQNAKHKQILNRF